jgi:hypothetical protein
MYTQFLSLDPPLYIPLLGQPLLRESNPQEVYSNLRETLCTNEEDENKRNENGRLHKTTERVAIHNSATDIIKIQYKCS